MIQRNITPRPFLKWVGGKGQLLDSLIACVSDAGDFGAYYEPFLGGGALFFEMWRRGLLSGKEMVLSDNNDRLIGTYRSIREDAAQVIRFLRQHKDSHSKDHYYRVRAEVPRNRFERAARIIYLNRTCFNGLYRENSRGEFNVPMGSYTNPPICDEENLRATAKALKQATVETRPFDGVLDYAQEGDLVYFDPPYHPVSPTSSFTAYHQEGFGEREQRRLADVFKKLHKRGVKVFLSNSETPFIRDLYEGFRIFAVSATRRVNSRADRRGEIHEVIVRSF